MVYLSLSSSNRGQHFKERIQAALRGTTLSLSELLGSITNAFFTAIHKH